VRHACGTGAAEGREALPDRHEPPPAAGGASVIRLAAIKAASGEADAALRHLDAALADRDPAVVYLGVSPLWDVPAW